MKLRRTTVLAGIEHALREKIIPLLEDDFARNEVHLATSLLDVDRMERDSAVALIVEEHARLRALFAEAAKVAEDADLMARLDMAATGRSDDLRISALEKQTGTLRDLLVDLHVHVEGRDDPAARDLDIKIWRAIRDTEDARNPRG